MNTFVSRGVEMSHEDAIESTLGTSQWSILDVINHHDVILEDSGRLSNCEDIKDQLNLIVNEIRSLRSRIDEIDASGYQVHGFDVHNTLKKRKEKLSSATKIGRSPDKPSILFVSFIIEALKDGAKSERGIKDFVIEQCKKHRLKSYRGGIVAGTHLDVGNVCAILAGIGFLENYQSSSSSSSSAADQNYYSLKGNNTMTTELCQRWGIILEEEDATLQRVPSLPQLQTIEPATTTVVVDDIKQPPTYSPLGNWLRATMGDPSTDHIEHPTNLHDEINSVNAELPSQGKIDMESGGEEEGIDALSADNMDLEFYFSAQDRLETDSASEFHQTLNLDSDIVKEGSVNAEGKTANGKKGGGSTKMWRITEAARQGDKIQMVTDPESFLENYVSKVFEQYAMQEVEEKLLRYVANQCKIDLPDTITAYATSYLDATFDDEVSVSKQQIEQLTVPTADVSDTASAMSTKDLFDSNVTITADYLINKILRTKRQRGSALTTPQPGSSPAPYQPTAASFSSKHIDLLKEVVEKTNESFWIVDESNKPLKKKRSNSTTAQPEKITLVEFARNTNTVFSNSSLSNHSFSNVLLAGEFPNVSMPLWKHYVPMLSVYDDRPEYAVNTVEIPWSTVASEFQPVGNDDCEANGVFVGNDHDKVAEPGSRSRSGTEHAIVTSSVVEAPLFRIVDFKTDIMDKPAADSEEEDIDDESMLRRHEFVLRRMRERWALLQKLKTEARRESGVSGPQTGSTSRKGVDIRSPSLRMSEVEVKINSGDYGKNNDIDSGSENQIKKRGRPPKTTKYSHYTSKYS